MGFGSRMISTEPSDESANTMNSPVLYCTNTRKPTVLLKRSRRIRVTVDYPEGINIHKTHLRPACPRTGSLLLAAPRLPAVAIQLRLAADAAISQVEKLPKGNFSGGAHSLGFSRRGSFLADVWRRLRFQNAFANFFASRFAF